MSSSVPSPVPAGTERAEGCGGVRDPAGHACVLPKGHNAGRADVPTNHAYESARTLDEWTEALGDDIAYWMGNPFLDADLRASKVAYWLNKAAAVVSSSPATPEGGRACSGCGHLLQQHGAQGCEASVLALVGTGVQPCRCEEDGPVLACVRCGHGIADHADDGCPLDGCDCTAYAPSPASPAETREGRADDRVERIAPAIHAIWCDDPICKPEHGTYWILPDLDDAARVLAVLDGPSS